MKPLEILYIEDDPADVLLLRSAFKLSDFQPNLHVARDGEAALKLVEKHKCERCLPDIILLDLNLPRLNGFDVLKHLRSDPLFLKIPVIVFSGSTNPEERSRSMELMANDFWNKPRNLPEAVEIANRIKTYPLPVFSVGSIG